jgi:cellulose synthase/poly-beta-1,6-N-acetylglucosamine synthase-like glycosyltransferase
VDGVSWIEETARVGIPSTIYNPPSASRLLVLAALYAAAMAVLLVFGLNQLVLSVQRVRADRLRAGPVPEPDALLDEPPGAWPVVTVQLPLYNERYVAARLIDAVAGLDYPRDRLEIQVLDDSTDDTAEIVASRVAYWQHRGFDVTHVRRSSRDGYKAGALANGLTFARGDLIAVFDADFVPDPTFLRRTVPHLADGRLGMVQARWAHLNAGDTWLTMAQSAFLDVHFSVEQTGRYAAGWLFHFNGTAGVWRRECIESAGGWLADTLTEDLDLSYRAQLAGWRFRYLEDIGVPAELPATMAAWRRQQFRWTKGTTETARKLLARVATAPLPLPMRLQSTLHLTSFAVYPAVLLVVATHAPLMMAHAIGLGVPDVFLGLMGIGVFALAGMSLSHILSQRARYPDWPRRLRSFPWWLAASIGLAALNTRAVWEALQRRRSAFERTPKGGYHSGGGHQHVETAVFLYGVVGLVGLIGVGAWAALPFQLLFVAGFGLAAGYDRWHARRTPSRLAVVPSG